MFKAFTTTVTWITGRFLYPAGIFPPRNHLLYRIPPYVYCVLSLIGVTNDPALLNWPACCLGSRRRGGRGELLGSGVFLRLLVAMVTIPVRIGTGKVLVVLIAAIALYPWTHKVYRLDMNPESALVVGVVRAGVTVVVSTFLT